VAAPEALLLFVMDGEETKIPRFARDDSAFSLGMTVPSRSG